jgi:hypothetical protein
LDVPAGQPNFFLRFDDVVIQPLMISFTVKMRSELANSVSQGPFAEEDHLIQAFGFQAQVEPFEVGVQVGTSRGWHEAQPGDEIVMWGQHRYLGRGQTRIGALLGEDGKIVLTTDRLVGEPLDTEAADHPQSGTADGHEHDD